MKLTNDVVAVATLYVTVAMFVFGIGLGVLVVGC